MADRKKLTHLIGNLGKDLKIVKSEKMVSDENPEGKIGKLSLATSVTYGSKDDPGDTFWCDLTLFDPKYIARAEEEKLKAGDKVAVSGYLSFRDGTGQYEGQKFAQLTVTMISLIDPWERTPYTPRSTASSEDDWQAPF